MSVSDRYCVGAVGVAVGSTTTFVPMGTAKGAGQWVDPPKLFGIKAGGGACLGAKGGSEGIVVIAHYRHQQ
jgi:hypothetical protein